MKHFFCFLVVMCLSLNSFATSPSLGNPEEVKAAREELAKLQERIKEAKTKKWAVLAFALTNATTAIVMTVVSGVVLIPSRGLGLGTRISGSFVSSLIAAGSAKVVYDGAQHYFEIRDEEIPQLEQEIEQAQKGLEAADIGNEALAEDDVHTNNNQ